MCTFSTTEEVKGQINSKRVYRHLLVLFADHSNQPKTHNNLTLEYDLLKTNYDNLTLEKNHLQTNYDALMREKVELAKKIAGETFYIKSGI